MIKHSRMLFKNLCNKKRAPRGRESCKRVGTKLSPPSHTSWCRECRRKALSALSRRILFGISLNHKFPSCCSSLRCWVSARISPSSRISPSRWDNTCAPSIIIVSFASRRASAPLSCVYSTRTALSPSPPFGARVYFGSPFIYLFIVARVHLGGTHRHRAGFFWCFSSDASSRR